MQVFFDRQYLPVIIPLIQKSESEILVAVYEWAWYDHQRTGTAQDLNRSICHQSKKGVSIKAILHHDYRTSHISKLNRNTASRLRKHGVEIHFASAKYIMHAKLWVFDSTTAIICTHNISTRAITTNRELGIVIDDMALVTQIKAYFLEIWNRSRDFRDLHG